MNPSPGPLQWITPDWRSAARVKALSTTRTGGTSSAPYASLNLGAGSGDDIDAVARNRATLQAAAAMPQAPLWLKQVHGTRCVAAAGAQQGCEADAAFSARPGEVCAVLTADCMPVLFCNDAGTQVAAAHAGWRGLRGGVLEAALACFDGPPETVQAWLGPCIGARAYEIGIEVYEAFVADAAADAACFEATRPGHWLADLPALARARLARCGVTRVSGGAWCTASEPQRFFSYRREGVTGRMATCIWLQD